jgi:hypothetical protein
MLPDSFVLWQRSFTEVDFLAMKIIPSHDKIPPPPPPPQSDERTNQRIDTTSKGLTTLVMDGDSNSSGVVGKGQPAETYLSSRS